MTQRRRKQLTLFVGEKHSSVIENVRRTFNPRQHELIPCHVTLCRDEELENVDVLLQTLERLQHHSLLLKFGDIERFSDGEGVLMPVVHGISEFQSLRNLILQNAVGTIKNLRPHVTLMHPRNSSCTDEVFEHLKNIELPKALEFRTISLIEQVGESKWNILSEFDLHDRS
jgi:hypothetical protein